MDLIYTDENHIDQGVLTAYAFDLSFGADENDFEMTLGANEPALSDGSFAYIEGTEYGGTVDGIKASTNSDTVTYKGRTWHGLLNSKVIEPDAGESYLIVSGDANELLAMLVDRLGLAGLCVAAEELSGINIRNYKFHRYCKGYDGIRDMLGDNGAKLKIAWKNRAVQLSAVPVVDYTDSPADSDTASLNVEKYSKKVNHLICLGRGDLAEREVIHLYVDQFGNIGDEQYYFGLDEFMDTYDNSNSEDLRQDGISHFKSLRNNDKSEFSPKNSNGIPYDIGDIVGASEIRTGITVAAVVTQKIIKIKNGVVSTEYKTGE